MLTHRPPNLVAAAIYLVGGLLIAACFLVTCFPSSAADVRSSITGNEWGVLIALVLVSINGRGKLPGGRCAATLDGPNC